MSPSNPRPPAGPAETRSARERLAGDLDTLLASRRDAELLDALRDLARRSGGIGRVAERAGLNRTFLYRMLSPSGNPEMRTMDAVLRTLGLRMGIRALHRRSNGRRPESASRRAATSRPAVEATGVRGARRTPRDDRRILG